MEEIMTLKHTSVSYDGKPVLKDVSMGIRKNRIMAVMGPSGCGKTTLLRSLNGLLWEEPGGGTTPTDPTTPENPGGTTNPSNPGDSGTEGGSTSGASGKAA